MTTNYSVLFCVSQQIYEVSRHDAAAANLNWESQSEARTKPAPELLLEKKELTYTPHTQTKTLRLSLLLLHKAVGR